MRPSAVVRTGACLPVEGPGSARMAVPAPRVECAGPRRDRGSVRAVGAGDYSDSRARMRGLIASARIEDGNRP